MHDKYSLKFNRAAFDSINALIAHLIGVQDFLLNWARAEQNPNTKRDNLYIVG